MAFVRRRPFGRKAIAGIALAAAGLGSANVAWAEPCRGMIARLAGRAEVKGFRDGPVINESVMVMRKIGGDAGLYGAWIATRTIDTQTFPHALPEAAAQLPSGKTAMTKGGVKLSCRTTMPGPNQLRTECTGRIPFNVTRGGIFMGKSFRVGKVKGRSLELSMLPGAAHWPVVRGEAMPVNKMRFDGWARSSLIKTGRPVYRLVIIASVTPKEWMGRLKIAHNFAQAAELEGGTVRAGAPQYSEDGSTLTLVADFPGMVRMTETIAAVPVRFSVDIGGCRRARTHTVAELLLLKHTDR